MPQFQYAIFDRGFQCVRFGDVELDSVEDLKNHLEYAMWEGRSETFAFSCSDPSVEQYEDPVFAYWFDRRKSEGEFDGVTEGEFDEVTEGEFDEVTEGVMMLRRRMEHHAWLSGQNSVRQSVFNLTGQVLA